jgi:hypothetical protein
VLTQTVADADALPQSVVDALPLVVGEPVDVLLSEAERDIDAAHGGDADAAQRARRALLDIDGVMADAELSRKWPELEAEARSIAISASSTVGLHGTDAERALLTEGLDGAERTTLQGATDAMIWSSAAAAALGSGIVVAVASYTALGLLGAALILLPVAAMLRGRAALRRS